MVNKINKRPHSSPYLSSIFFILFLLEGIQGVIIINYDSLLNFIKFSY